MDAVIALYYFYVHALKKFGSLRKASSPLETISHAAIVDDMFSKTNRTRVQTIFAQFGDYLSYTYIFWSRNKKPAIVCGYKLSSNLYILLYFSYFEIARGPLDGARATTSVESTHRTTKHGALIPNSTMFLVSKKDTHPFEGPEENAQKAVHRTLKGSVISLHQLSRCPSMI